MPCSTPPSTWLAALSGLMTRPMSCTATTRSQRTSPVPGSTATCAIWQPNVWIARPSGFGPRPPSPAIDASPSFSVTAETRLVERAVRRAEAAAATSARSAGWASNTSPASSSSCRRTSSPAARTAGITDGVVMRAARDGPVDVRPRVAAAHDHALRRQAERLGGDDLRRRQRARADVLDAGRRPARRRPSRGGSWRAPAGRPSPTRSAARSPCRAAGRRAAARAARSRSAQPASSAARVMQPSSALTRVRLAAHLVDVGVVAPPQLERVEPELRRQHVHRLLQAGRALHHAGRAEGVGRREVDLEREQQAAHVVAVVERHRGRQHRRCAAGRADRDERRRRRWRRAPVARRAEAHGLARRGAAAAVELLARGGR